MSFMAVLDAEGDRALFRRGTERTSLWTRASEGGGGRVRPTTGPDLQDAVAVGSDRILALAKQLVERNGAWLSFESEKGRGSTFRIHLPPALELAGEASADGSLAS